MTPVLRAIMERWLESGDPVERKAAAFRLGLRLETDVSPPPERPPLSETLALLRRMHACPDRDPTTDCGCGGLATCRRGRGNAGLVNHQDCLDCLRET